MRQVWFDIETEPFSEEFGCAVHIQDKLALAPKMHLACVFDGTEWYYFTVDDAVALIEILSKANEVISFNGTRFDELVLRRHHGLAGNFPKKGRHVDLCAEIYEAENRRVSLHALAQLNLGEKKHTKGRNMASLNLETLKLACRSDVWQTYRLWKLWSEGRLQIPKQQSFEQKIRDSFAVGPGDHMPDLCPNCHDTNTLIFSEHDVDEMSEGQEADYLAGGFGSAICEACNFEFDWGF